MKKTFLFVAFTLALFGCDTGVEEDLISVDNLFAVSSFISPEDSLLTLYLYKAQKPGQFPRVDSALVTNAEVVISDEADRADTLQYVPENERYEAVPNNLTIEPLKTYFLKITIPLHQTLEAYCTIPPEPDPYEMTGYREEDHYYFDVSWKDSGNINFFVLSVNARGTFELDTPSGIYEGNLSPRLLDEIEFPLRVQNSFYAYQGIVPYVYKAENAELTVSLMSIDEALYLYFKSYQQYYHWAANNSDPFPSFLEVKPIYSNIEGGVGIFGGRNQRIVKITF